MKVWVDTQSGTWGDASTIRILTTDMDEEQFGEDMDDDDRASYAAHHGVLPQECRESNVVMSDTDPKGQK